MKSLSALTRLTRHAHLALFALVPTLVSTAAFAAEHGAEHEAESEPHVANWWHVGAEYSETPALGLLTITFLIFAIGLFIVARKPIAEMVENRSNAVKKAIEEAKRAKEAAEAKARDAEQRLKNLEAEVVKMKSDFEAQGKAELDRLEKAAHEASTRIAKDAEDTIAAESERARQALRMEAAKLALEMAEERIRSALSGSDDTRLQKALLDGLAKDRPQA